jgi:hypothetical protein
MRSKTHGHGLAVLTARSADHSSGWYRLFQPPQNRLGVALAQLRILPSQHRAGGLMLSPTVLRIDNE